MTQDMQSRVTSDQRRNRLAEVTRDAAAQVLIGSKTVGASNATHLEAIGVDLVHVPEFVELLSTPGSRFATPGKVFTPREFRRAESHAAQKGDGLAAHLATLWALKEATLKAWLSALAHLQVDVPLNEQEMNWSQITVRHTASGVPSIKITGEMEEVFQASLAGLLGPRCGSHLSEEHLTASASHDGLYAVAVVAIRQCCA